MRKPIKMFLFTVLEIAALFLFVSQSVAVYYTTKPQDCGQYVNAPQGWNGKHRMADPKGGWQTKGFIIDSFGPMPQTAYDPNYGCYPGNARTIHRYPAFHGYYYDRPYNYRHYTEYPWNADLSGAEPKPYPILEQGNRSMYSDEDVPGESIMTMPSDSSNLIEEPANVIPEQIKDEGQGSIPTTQITDPLLEGLL